MLAEPVALQQIIHNLLMNALQALEQVPENQRHLALAIATEGPLGCLTVQDNGPGIPDSIKDKIFQPFFTTKPTGQGTGLGLSLSYDIIKAHGGSLSVTSDANGSNFIFTLPMT